MTRLFILFSLAMLAGASHAQERAAVGAVDTQMTWSALSDQINSVNTTVKAVDAKLTQVTVCGKKGLVYAPGATGSDSDGCHEVTLPVATSTTLTNLTTNQTNLTNSVNNIVACEKAGQSFDGSKCVATPAMSCTTQVVAPAKPNNSNSGTAGTCPSGTISSYSTKINASGSRDGPKGDLITTVTCYAVVCK